MRRVGSCVLTSERMSRNWQPWWQPIEHREWNQEVNIEAKRNEEREN